MKSKLLMLLISLTLIFTFMPAMVFADDEEPSSSTEYTSGNEGWGDLPEGEIPDIEIDKEETVNVTTNGQVFTYKFVAPETAKYYFESATSDDEADPVGRVTDDSYAALFYEDDNEVGSNFGILFSAVEGKTYYLQTKNYYSNTIASFSVTLFREPEEKNWSVTESDVYQALDSYHEENGLYYAYYDTNENITRNYHSEDDLTYEWEKLDSDTGEYETYDEGRYLYAYSVGDYRVTITDNDDSSKTDSFVVHVTDIWGELPDSVEDIDEGDTRTVETTEDARIATYKFQAPANGIYYFTTSSNNEELYVNGRVADSDFSDIAVEKRTMNFSTHFEATEGSVYYLQSMLYGNEVGSISMSIYKQPENVDWSVPNSYIDLGYTEELIDAMDYIEYEGKIPPYLNYEWQVADESGNYSTLGLESDSTINAYEGDFKVIITDTSKTAEIEFHVTGRWGDLPDNPEKIQLEETRGVAISEPYQVTTFVFIAPEDGYYVFKSTGDIGDPLGRVTDSNYEEIVASDDAEDSNFAVKFTGVKGETYYLQATEYGRGTAEYSVELYRVPDNIEWSLSETYVDCALEYDDEEGYYYAVLNASKYVTFEGDIAPELSFSWQAKYADEEEYSEYASGPSIQVDTEGYYKAFATDFTDSEKTAEIVFHVTAAQNSESSLDDVKEEAIENLKKSYSSSAYRPEQQEEIAELIEEAAEAINAAEDIDTVKNIESEYLEKIGNVKTAAQINDEEAEEASQNTLDELKAKKIKELKNAYVLSDYRTEEQAEIRKLLSEAETAINAAETADAVNKAVIEATNKLRAVKTDAQLDTEETQTSADKLAAAKAAAKAELDKIDVSQYDGAEKAAVEKAIADAKAAIDKAANTDAIDAAKAAATKTIAGQKTTLQKNAETAANKLAVAKAAAKAELDKIDVSQYDGAEKAAVEKAIADAKAAIDKAANTDAIDAAKAAATKAIAALKTLSQKKEEAQKETEKKAAAEAREALNNSITEVKKIEKGNYTDESYKALQDAISEAEKVAADPNATSEQLKVANAKIEEAKKALAKKPDPAKQYGKDGTAVGSGASKEAAEAAIAGMTSDNDLPGSVFNKLQLKSSKQTNTSISLSWKKVSGAKKYVIYGNKCGKTKKMKRLATSTGKSRTIKKVLGKNLKKGTYYKFMIVALDKDDKVVSSSKIIHVATKGGKVGNVGKVTTKAKKNKVTIKKSKSFKLAGKQVAASKKLTVKVHRKVSYESSNPKVAKVSKKGVITGKKKGTCYVYAYAQNGVFAKIKVTVK